MKNRREYQRDDVYMPAVIFKRLFLLTSVIFVVLGTVTYCVVRSAGF